MCPPQYEPALFHVPLTRALVLDDPVGMLGPAMLVLGAAIVAPLVARRAGRQLNSAGYALGPVLGTTWVLLSVGLQITPCDQDELCFFDLARFAELGRLEGTFAAAALALGVAAVRGRSRLLASWAGIAVCGVTLAEAVRTLLWAGRVGTDPTLVLASQAVIAVSLGMGAAASLVAWRSRPRGRVNQTVGVLATVVLAAAAWADFRLLTASATEALLHL